jgi:hypothetical protein
MRNKRVTRGLVTLPTGEFVVDLGGGFTLPALGAFTVEGDASFMYDVTIRYRWWEGRFDAVAVHVDGREDYTVTGEVLRRVPVERLLRGHLAGSVRIPERLELRSKDAAGELAELAHVAAIYRVAYLVHEPPARAVAEQLGISISTAGKKVMAARQAGFLAPATQGKAGT